MSKTRFRNAAVIGTGMMGPGIAGALAMGGVRATIVGRTEESATKGLDAARAQLRILAENGLAEMVEVRDAYDRLGRLRPPSNAPWGVWIWSSNPLRKTWS